MEESVLIQEVVALEGWSLSESCIYMWECIYSYMKLWIQVGWCYEESFYKGIMHGILKSVYMYRISGIQDSQLIIKSTSTQSLADMSRPSIVIFMVLHGIFVVIQGLSSLTLVEGPPLDSTLHGQTGSVSIQCCPSIRLSLPDNSQSIEYGTLYAVGPAYWMETTFSRLCMKMKVIPFMI